MLQDVKQFTTTHKNAVLLNIIAVCVCYIHMVFSQNVGIDTEIIMSNEAALIDYWNGNGRQGLMLSKLLFNLKNYNPYFAGVLFLMLFILLGVMVAFFCYIASGRNDNYPYGLFLVLFSSSPIWMYQFYFALQRAEVVLGLTYAVISSFAFCQIVFYCQRKIYWFLAWILFGIWSFCTYQGCIMFYIGLCIIFFLLDFVQNYMKKGWREYTGIIVKLLGGFCVIYIVNMVITMKFFGMGEYLTGQILWGKMDVTENLYRIAGHIVCCLIWYKLHFRSAYPLAALCIAVLFGGFCRKRDIKKSMKIVFFLALAGMMATPFLLTVYIGGIPISRSQFVLQLISAFSCMFAYGIWYREKDRKYKWMRGGIIVISIIITWVSIQTILRLQYTDDVRYKEDVCVANSIWEDIQHTEGMQKDLPVIFVGGYSAELNGVTESSDAFGLSFLGWDYTPENPSGATERIIGFMKTQGIPIESTGDYKEEAVVAARSMKSYPEPGYILVEKNFVVVKLSDME